MEAGGIALAPIAGAISAWGLNLPWLVCGACAGLAGVFAAACFRNAAELRAAKAEGAPPAKPGGEPGKPGAPLYKDRVLLVMFGSYFAMFVCVSGLVLLVPLLLESREKERRPGLAAGATTGCHGRPWERA